MMHFGTNDVWSNLSPATILAAFTKLVGQMRAANPAMKILVAQILPMNPGNCADCAPAGGRLQRRDPGLGGGDQPPPPPRSRSSTSGPASTTATDTYDGVHPNDSGNTKIADRWYPALTAALS